MDGSDTIFRKGIQLLNSNADGATDQLRLLLEETIRQRYGNTRSLNLKKDYYVKNESPTKLSGSLSSKKDGAKKYSEKRSSKSSDDRSVGDAGPSLKTLDFGKSSHLKASGSNLTKSKPDLESVSMSLLRDLDAAKEEVRLDEEDDLALEILEEDLTCVICRGMDVGVRNQLVECLECHSLYHQECHQPPVPDDMNDPRSAWYCASCMKALNKMGATGGLTSSSRQKSTSGTNVSTSSAKPHAPGNSKSGSGSSSKVSGGFTAPVKTHSSSSSSKASSSSSGGSSKSAVPKINVVSADKRLANMKKRAAEKLKKLK